MKNLLGLQFSIPDRMSLVTPPNLNGWTLLGPDNTFNPSVVSFLVLIFYPCGFSTYRNTAIKYCIACSMFEEKMICYEYNFKFSSLKTNLIGTLLPCFLFALLYLKISFRALNLTYVFLFVIRIQGGLVLLSLSPWRRVCHWSPLLP